MIQIHASHLDLIEPLRKEYFSSLPFFQDIFIEFQVPHAGVFTISFADTLTGYFLISPEKILLELYAEDSYYDLVLEALKDFLYDLGIEKIYCKSFDYYLLDFCLRFDFSYQIAAFLYHNITPVYKGVGLSLSHRYASQTDLPFLFSQQDEVFQPKDLLEECIQTKSLSIFTKNNQIVGCGFTTRVHQDFNYYDIGVWVAEQSRQKGYGTQIMLFLTDLCLKKHNRPICGCSVDNVESQKVLAKAGFVSRHKLLEFTID